MKGRIGVKIPGGRYAQLLTLDGPSKGDLELVPIDPQQHRAVIRIALTQHRRTKTIREINLRVHPISKCIRVHGIYDGRSLLSLKVFLDDDNAQNSEIDLGPHARRRLSPWVVLALILIAVLIAIWVVAPKPLSGNRPPGGSGRRTATSPEALTAPNASKNLEVIPSAPVGNTAYSVPIDPPTGDNPIVGEPVGENRTGEILRWNGETVFFEAEESTITPAAQQVLLAALPFLVRSFDRRVFIQGHTAPYGTVDNQMSLSLERAEAVRDFLYQHGWKPAQDPVIEGFGANRATSYNPQYYPLNRRVEIIFEKKES